MKREEKVSEADKNVTALKTVNILGVGVVSSNKEQVINILSREINKRDLTRPFFVVTVNPEFVMEAQRDGEFKRILNKADLALPDGVGLKLASREMTEIIPGRKVVEELLNKKIKVFYLGGENGVAKVMAQKFGGEWDEGENNIKAGDKETQRIVSKINKYQPDLLLVAYGAPWQEKWIWRHREEIKAKVVIGVGGTFDSMAGRVKLPPKWVEKMGWEWLWRLKQEPWRWRRQLNLIKFVWRVLVK